MEFRDAVGGGDRDVTEGEGHLGRLIQQNPKGEIGEGTRRTQ